MFELFREYIIGQGRFTEEEIDYFKSNVGIRIFKKEKLSSFLLNHDRYLYLLLTGCVRLFCNIKGKDLTIYFYKEESLIWNNFNIKSQQMNFEALEDSILVQINKQQLVGNIELSSKFKDLFISLINNEITNYQHMLFDFITLNPEGRYKKLMEINSELFLRVPQQHIATFIGVSAETLCRIKRRVLRKDHKRA